MPLWRTSSTAPPQACGNRLGISGPHDCAPTRSARGTIGLCTIRPRIRPRHDPPGWRPSLSNRDVAEIAAKLQLVICAVSSHNWRKGVTDRSAHSSRVHASPQSRASIPRPRRPARRPVGPDRGDLPSSPRPRRADGDSTAELRAIASPPTRDAATRGRPHENPRPRASACVQHPAGERRRPRAPEARRLSATRSQVTTCNLARSAPGAVGFDPARGFVLAAPRSRLSARFRGPSVPGESTLRARALGALGRRLLAFELPLAATDARVHQLDDLEQVDDVDGKREGDEGDPEHRERLP